MKLTEGFVQMEKKTRPEAGPSSITVRGREMWTQASQYRPVGVDSARVNPFVIRWDDRMTAVGTNATPSHA